MALLPDAADFYLCVGIAWMLSATLAIAILRGWIRAHGLRPKKSYLFVLVYSLLLAKDGLRLRVVYRNILEYYRRCCPRAVDLPTVEDYVLVGGLYIRDLVQVADRCYMMLLLVVLVLWDAIWEERMPQRPRVPERRDLSKVGGILIEILILFCVLSCIIGLPIVLQDYMAATANGGDAAVV